MSNQGIPASSTINRTAKVIVDRNVRDKNGRVSKQKTTVPAHQLSQCRHTDIVYRQSCKSVVSNLFRNSGSKYSATLEQKSFHKLESMCLRIELSVASATVSTAFNLVPPAFWFDRVEIRGNNGSKFLTTLYAEQLYLALGTLDPVTFENYNRLMGMTVADNVITTGTDFTSDGSGNATVVVYLPLLGSWIDHGDLWFKGIDGDLIFDFFPSANIKGVQANTYVVSCTSMDFVVQTEMLSQQDIDVQTKFHNSINSEVNFLDVVPVEFYAQTVTASSQLKLELDALGHGEYAFLAVYIKSTSGNSTTRPRTGLNDLGDTAKVDILDAGSQSIIGSGTGIELQYLKNFVNPKHFNNRLLENHDILIVPFCGNVSEAYRGNLDGCLKFDAQRWYLALTPDANWSTTTYDITIHAYKMATLYLNHGDIAVSR